MIYEKNRNQQTKAIQNHYPKGFLAGRHETDDAVTKQLIGQNESTSEMNVKNPITGDKVI